MVRYPVTKRENAGQEIIDLATRPVSLREGMTQMGAPEFLIATNKQSPPKSKGQCGNNSVVSWGLLGGRDDALDCSVHPFPTPSFEHLGVSQPNSGLADRERF